MPKPKANQRRVYHQIRASVAATYHRPRREGDEVACACGARWAVGEEPTCMT